MRSPTRIRRLLAGLAAACALAAAQAAPGVVTIAHGLVNPWAVAFLPDGRFLVTERAGRMRTIGPSGC